MASNLHSVQVNAWVPPGILLPELAGQVRIDGMPNGGVANFDHLIPILSDVERWMNAAEQRPFPRPEPGSALAEDDKRLRIYPGSHLVADGISAAVDHLDAFRHLVVKAQAL